MPNCLDNLITLEGVCDQAEQKSAVSLTSLGITKTFLEDVITGDYASLESFFASKYALSLQVVSNALHSFFQSKYKAVSVVDGFKAGYENENKVVINSNSKYKGIYFERNATDSYLNYHLSELSLFTDFTGAITVRVFDLLQGKEIDSIDVVTVAGEIATVNPLKTYSFTNKKISLFIAYDTTGINSYKTVLNSSSTCTRCTPQYRVRNSWENIYSAEMPLSGTNLKSSLNYINETGGMSITHSLQCNHADWLCGVSNLIALPIAYKFSALACETGLYENPNSRYNTTTGTNADLLRERLNLYEFKFREALDNVIKSINVPNDSTCFHCKKSHEHKIVLP